MDGLKDLLFRNGSHQNYQLSVSGGNDRTKFYTSVAYTNQEGIIYKQGLERFTGNANLTHKFGDFEVQVTSQFSKVDKTKLMKLPPMMDLWPITHSSKALINPL